MNMGRKLTGILALLLAGILGFVFVLFPLDSETNSACDFRSNSFSVKEPLSVCHLVQTKSPDDLVQVTGTFVNDSQQLSLHNGECFVLVGFANPQKGAAGSWRKLQMVSGARTWYDGRADVTLIGRMGTIPPGNYYEGESGFVVSCIEQVRTEPKLRDRIRYNLHRLMP
jgi:hypothetical protein